MTKLRRLNNYSHTIAACLCGSFIQAITLNFAPLLFLTFHSQFSVSLAKVGFLVTINFGIQLLIDLLFSRIADRVSQRLSLVTAHVMSALGLICLGFLPDIMPDAYTGLVISTIIYGIGGGLLEVTVSPIVEACPTKRKSATMALLHSFYCWGYVLTVLISTLYFVIFGIENWQYLAMLWAIIPAVNTVYLMFVPMPDQESADREKMEYKVLFRNKIFWIMLIMMVCAGAAEQGICQWASAFAEAGLGVSKAVGDLTGPLLFALFMGFSRIIYAKFSEKLDLRRYMFVSVVLCAFSYLCIALVPNPVIALIACSVCGFACGIFWPGTLSLAAGSIPKGGGMMFALLALGGDLGCTTGPTLVSTISSFFGENLKRGFLFAAVFPFIMIVLFLVLRRVRKNKTI